MAGLLDLEHYTKVRDGWLIDTNIISATIGNKPLHPGISRFFEAVPDEQLYLSVLTIGELRKGVATHRLLTHKLNELQNLWTDRILPIGLDVANKWGELAAHYQRTGTTTAIADGLMAATACVYNLVIVSSDAIFSRMREHVTVYDPLLA